VKRRIVICLAVFAIVGLYVSGRLDHLLYNAGLNYHECARNGLGATFCGSELTEYRARITHVSEEDAKAETAIKEDQAKSEAYVQDQAEERTRLEHAAEPLAVKEAEAERYAEEAVK
jgi:hypothetical protein